MTEPPSEFASRLSHGLRLAAQSKDLEALSVLEGLLSEDPASFEAFEAYSSLLLRADRVQELAALSMEFAARRPDLARAQALCVGILNVLEHFGVASLYDEKAAALGMSVTDRLETYGDVARQAGEVQKHLAYSEARAFAVEGDRQQALYRHALICLQYHELERAEQVLDKLDPESKPGKRLAAFLDAIHGRGDALADRIKSWLAAPGAGPDIVWELETIWSNTAEPRVFDLFKSAVHRWIDDPAIGVTALSYHFARLDGTLDTGRPAISNIQMTPNNYLLLSEALIDHNQPERAKAVLDAFVDNEDKTAILRRAILYQMADRLPRDHELRRPIVRDDPEQEVICSQPGEPGKLAVVFTGLNGRPLVGVQTLDRALSGLGYQAIYLRDFQRLGYFNGIRSLDESFSKSVERLQAIVSATGAEDPVFMGCSIGSYAAASFGVELGIRRITLFGFHDRLESFSRWRIGNSRAPTLMARQKLASNGPIEPLSQKLERAGYPFELRIVYGEDNPVDCFYVRRLQKIPGVHLIELKDWSAHDTLSPLLANGRLRQLLD